MTAEDIAAARTEWEADNCRTPGNASPTFLVVERKMRERLEREKTP